MNQPLSARIPNDHLAAIALLKKKVHQGLPSSNPALYQGPSVCKSTTALGLRAALHLERVRSRYTGKERDAESGLDYFGARYLSSNLGRFMTPDWAAAPTNVPYASFGDPQTLNLYAYVGNNPNTGIDLDGHEGCCVLEEVEETVEAAAPEIEAVGAGIAAGAGTGAEDGAIGGTVVEPGGGTAVGAIGGGIVGAIVGSYVGYKAYKSSQTPAPNPSSPTSPKPQDSKPPSPTGAEHTKNARPSTSDKHTKRDAGQSKPPGYKSDKAHTRPPGSRKTDKVKTPYVRKDRD